MSNAPAWVQPSAPDQPGAIDREAHGQVLDRDIVHHLVVGALQEGRIDRRKGRMPSAARPAAKVTAVLFGDADVERTVRMRLGELVDAGAAGHGGGDGDDLVVVCRPA